MSDHAGCFLSGPGRGDCEHFVGLPGKSIPGQHDGPDDTVDHYGKPNGWCWSCWKSYRIAILEMHQLELMELLEDHRQQYANKCLELIAERAEK